MTCYAFMVQRPTDKEPWPTIFTSLDLALNYPHRVTCVTHVEFFPTTNLVTDQDGMVVKSARSKP